MCDIPISFNPSLLKATPSTNLVCKYLKDAIPNLSPILVPFIVIVV
jgi:hypothetical protein